MHPKITATQTSACELAALVKITCCISLTSFAGHCERPLPLECLNCLTHTHRLHILYNTHWNSVPISDTVTIILRTICPFNHSSFPLTFSMASTYSTTCSPTFFPNATVSSSMSGAKDSEGMTEPKPSPGRQQSKTVDTIAAAGQMAKHQALSHSVPPLQARDSKE